MADQALISSIINDNRPLAVRRTRRHSTAPALSAHSQSKVSIRQQHGINTPPSTPKRSSKRVRFSSPSTPTTPSTYLSPSTGLTPFISRTTLSAPSSHQQTPSNIWHTCSHTNSPLSGTLQFVPLRQVLSGRVTRRLRRNRLSEEVNVITWEKRVCAREKRSEIQRLRDELAARDTEVRGLRDELDIAGQLEGEIGLEAGNGLDTELNARVLEQENEIRDLREELKRREDESGEEEEEEEVDWTLAAKDPFAFDHDGGEDEDVMMLTHYSSPNNIKTIDDVPNTLSCVNTNTSCSFPSLPSTFTNPNTPQNRTPLSFADIGIQAHLPDPETLLFTSRLKDLETEIAELTASSAFTSEHQARLLTKLSQYIPSSPPSTQDTEPDHSTLDLALDTILTTLFLAQTSTVETTQALSTLRSSILSLNISSSPTRTLSLLASQFRSARIELEYLAPGENISGFDNGKLIGMLVDRVRYLSERVVKMDSQIDQYHEDGLLLRKQLTARVDGMDEMHMQISSAASLAQELRVEVGEKEADNERLKTALASYRTEIRDLEESISRVEAEAKEREHDLNTQLSTSSANHALAIAELESRLQSACHNASQLAAELASLTTSTDHTMSSLRTSLLAKDTILTQLQAQTHLSLQSSTLARAAQDTQVRKLKEELESVNRALADAKGVVQELLEQMMRTSEVALGFINGEDTSLEKNNGTDQHAGLFTGAPKRRSSAGTSVEDGGRTKRRRYDSGLAFLSEEDEDELGAGDGCERV